MDIVPPTANQSPSRSFGDELRQLLRLGLPIALVQLGLTGLNFVDLAMLGHYDAAALPAMALGNTLVWIGSMFCMGALAAADPLLSQAVGAGDHAAIPRVFGRTLLLAVALSLPAALLLLPAATWLEVSNQPADLIAPAADYARWQMLSILPFLWFTTCRSVLSAHARLWPQVATIVGGNLLNALLDWIFIFGEFGVPAMGAHGAAIATVLCRWLMLAGLVVLGWRDLAPALKPLRDRAVREAAFALAPLLRLLRLGTPIGAQFLLEMGVFAAVALLIGDIDHGSSDGADGPRVAGHQVALQLASLSFMVPLGLAMAASVRVGWAIGRGDGAAAERAARAAITLAAIVMTGFMLLFLLAPGPLAGALTDQPRHLAYALVLIPIAGVFQIGDGVQVVAIGCLRGLGDVRSPVLANVVGFWLLGLPLGCYFAFGLGWGPEGLWWGLVIGLFVVATALLEVLRRRLGERRDRLAVE